MEKMNFIDLCISLGLNSATMQEYVAQLSRVPPATIESMMAGAGRVLQNDAEEILRAISAYAKKEYTLENVYIPIKMPFVEVWSRHRLLARDLNHDAGVSAEVLFAMMNGKPVGREDAEKVLTALNALTKREYTLENVEVRLLEDEEGDAGASNDHH